MIPAVLVSALLLATAPRPAPSWAVGVLPDGSEFSLEVAADPGTRARGYMGRERVGPREGMLFVFESADRHSFWMKNCLTRLDIVWLGADLRIRDIAHDLPPCPAQGDCPGVRPRAPARYAVELAGGTARRHKLRVGDRLIVLSDPPLP